MARFTFDPETQGLSKDGLFIACVDPEIGEEIARKLNEHDRASQIYNTFLLADLYTSYPMDRQRGFVTRLTLPPFNKFPDVLIWGTRVFNFFGGFVDLKEDRRIGQYTEAFAYHVPEQG